MLVLNEVDNVIMLVDRINDMHKEFSESWIVELEDTYNLKSKQIRHISNHENGIDSNFYEYINNYCDKLTGVQLSDAYDELSEIFNITSRVKNPDSRMSKILHYRNTKGENGAVNINKCLNDLLGIRLFIHDFDHTDEVEAHLKIILEKFNVKVHNSCKGRYKATHIYFSNSNNRYFPWELQIWSIKDYDVNIKSHAEYKQGYTKWPKIYHTVQNVKEGKHV